ncbi:transmembrane protease serine 9-like [Neodiprion fabricii]|uniref:transmembrane protease serine 9-like n=1 Tax=Neodiprion fabricii TaxID=2872261 RepID=UPI001ED90DD6|nr:transmembrane protease serine 9-like [Neodiprion fabricii]
MILVSFLAMLLLCLLCPVQCLNSALKSAHRSSRQLDNSYGSPSYKHCECGRSNSRGGQAGYTRVVGGVKASPNEFPWMAMVVANGSNLVCGGSLINDRYVLTAAHCLALGFSKAETKVALGEHDRCTADSRTVILSVEKFYPHPQFQEDTNHADAMLIRLNMRVTFNEFIRPICLPKMILQRSTASRFGGKVAFTLGWGRADHGVTVCSLRVVALEIYETQSCPTKIPTLLCAGSRQAAGRDACQGDSGGPLQVRNKDRKFELIGIVSNGIGCGNQDFPGLYTDVPRLLPWILKVTSEDSMYCWPFFYSNLALAMLLPYCRKDKWNKKMQRGDGSRGSHQLGAVIRHISTMKRSAALFAIWSLLIHQVVESRKTLQPKVIDPECECGVSGEGVGNRIVGGVISVPHTFPWVAAIFNRGSLHCGGTLINDRYILTAGHCVKWTNQNDLSVWLGIHDIENRDGGVVSPIEQVILHDGFRSDFLHDTNDIALIKLKYPIRYNENIKPVCLPHRESDYTNHKVSATGWGRVTTSGNASRFLRQADLKVMPWSDCRNTSFGNHLTKSMLCAYNDDTDACQGDSGGPLLFKRQDDKYEIVGVVSWGIGCARRGMPGIYVKTTDYLDWITARTTTAIYCADN